MPHRQTDSVGESRPRINSARAHLVEVGESFLSSFVRIYVHALHLQKVYHAPEKDARDFSESYSQRKR